MAQAAALDKKMKKTGKRSLLHGIPILLKDNIATIASEGLNTTAGSFGLLGSVVPNDAGVVKRFRKAGAIILESAMAQAAALDKKMKKTGKRSLLHGIPILLKDNIATIASQGLNTTAGPFGLLGSVVPNDAGVVKRFRKAGAIILEVNWLRGGLDEVVKLRTHTSSMPIWLAADIKPPTVCQISRQEVCVLISSSGYWGPYGKALYRRSHCFICHCWKDPNDNFTLAQPRVVPDFTKALNKKALKGKRIGVPCHVFLNDSISRNDLFMNVVFEQALATIRDLRATMRDPADLCTLCR
ncbi:hypothetical protein CVT25_006211 [Psilocybe cyanescens]|uniref:Amidase domain-containing protein n=1 Tax=Psilocybe cyanescens TaxID=93625 RepID=A0A409XQF5_PSICY|nr:hypothetical protein CVT25_006211 [Psilocybe cyanescens]